MRIPIPVVILLCLAVVAGAWWHGTRDSDFLTPPPDSKLAAIRAKVEFSLPPADHPDDVVAVPKPAEEAMPPEPVQEPRQAVAITLHAGTGKTTAAILGPVLENVAREIEQASAGDLKISVVLASGRDIPSSIGPAPVALWLAGSAADARSTEVISFTVGTPETLHSDVVETLFKLVRGYLVRTGPVSTAAPLKEGEGVVEPGKNLIPQQAWRELGTRLNHPPD